MTRLLFIPDTHTLIWLVLAEDPASLVASILSGQWQPPPPYTDLSRRLRAYWQANLVIASVFELNGLSSVPPKPALPRHQRELLKLLADGLTTRQIAARLGLQERAVFLRIAALKRAFDAVSRADLIHKARDLLG